MNASDVESKGRGGSFTSKSHCSPCSAGERKRCGEQGEGRELYLEIPLFSMLCSDVLFLTIAHILMLFSLGLKIFILNVTSKC